jgi:glycosyltransferase involved in cell wall biosynthesis
MSHDMFGLEVILDGCRLRRPLMPLPRVIPSSRLQSSGSAGDGGSHDGPVALRGDLDELDAAIVALEQEPRLTVALRLAEDVRRAAALASDPVGAAERLIHVVREGDGPSALGAIHALGSVSAPGVDDLLLELLEEGDEPFAGHAAWALGARRSSPEAIAALIALASGDGFSAMLAERTLVEWGRHDDPDEHDGPVSGSALVAARVGDHAPTGSPGVVVVQPFLHARIDRDGTSLGSGDAGGIASLLRSLGTSLAGVDGIAEVITVTRRHDGEDVSEHLAPGHRVMRIDVGPPGPMPWRQAWTHRIEIERQLSELGRSLEGRQVVWHLRMADVGTLAAAAAARRLGQAVVFTAAPDPHIVIDALQDDGRLDRARFAVEDAALQYWFRARMVERLTAQADRLVVLPRPTIGDELVELLGVDRSELERVSVVPEGVDVAQIDRARARRAQRGTPPAVQRIIAALPPERRCLPWILSVGRLHPTKGPQRIVDAVISEPGLSQRVNVVLVGGDLRRPSADEQSTIELVRAAARGADPALVTLTGNLPPADVADLLVEVADHGGVYVCASDKEEFGLAIVEAMAAGAVVVAPARGGPRSYVDDGDTGVLCDTLSPPAVRAAVLRAMSLAGDVDAVERAARARRARDKVRRDLSVDAMAASLAVLYREVTGHPSEDAPVPSVLSLASGRGSRA